MYYLQITSLAAINCLLALAAYLPLSTGLMVVCLGALMGLGAVVAAAAYSSALLPFPLAILLGGAAAGLGGALVAVLCRRQSGFLYAVATIGLGELARVLVVNSATFGGALGYKDVQLVPVAQNLLWLSVALAVCALLFLLFERTHARKAFTLIREDEVLASSLGVNVARHRLMAVAGGGILAGLAGGFYVHGVGLLEPRIFGFEQSLLILMYPVFGGRRNFAGPVVGAALLTIIPEAFRFSTSLRMILYGLVLVLVVVFRPGGIIRERINVA